MATPAPPDQTDTTTTTTPASKRSWVDVALIALLLAAVAGITSFVVIHFDQNATNAATILGIVIPALATIGAAIFGVTVAYNAGQTTGKAAGAAGKDEAISDATKQTALKFAPGISSAAHAINAFHGDIHTRAASPPGTHVLAFLEPEAAAGTVYRSVVAGAEYRAVEIDPTPLDNARRELDRLQGIVDTLS